MAIDLKKILAISGKPGLYEYVAAAKNGFIVEAVESKQRSAVPATAKVTTLADVSIYTDEGEATLMQVLESMRDALGGEVAMSSKSDSEQIKAFFAKVLPTYDRDRFYVSHMKKVLDWYNHLARFASLDFEKDEEPAGEENEKTAE